MEVRRPAAPLPPTPTSYPPVIVMTMAEISATIVGWTRLFLSKLDVIYGIMAKTLAAIVARTRLLPGKCDVIGRATAGLMAAIAGWVRLLHSKWKGKI